MNSVIKLVNINHQYNEEFILKDFSCDILENELVAITGASGKGKSTILNIMNMIIKPTSGDVIINDVVNPTFDSDEGRELLHNNLGVIFQNNLLLENETVINNLNIYGEKTPTEVAEVLSLVKLNGFENKKIYELSGGEQQRVAIARTILKKCNIILADEITGNLDIDNRDIVFDLLKLMQNNGATIILVTHDIELANKCDRTIKL